MSQYYAHSKPNRPVEEWQSLEAHLENVAEKAAEFAGVFGAAEWGHAAGWLHDVGKFSEAYQDYLRAVTDADPHVAETAGKVDHSTAGAQHAATALGILGHLLAYPLAGHHSGLLNGVDVGTCQQARLRKAIEPYAGGLSSLPNLSLPVPAWLGRAFVGKNKNAFRVAFFARILYSCLVDADFLDTEAFMDEGQSRLRRHWRHDILRRMTAELDREIASFGPAASVVDRHRATVREDCLRAAEKRPGLFSLTVPTGGGKTLASLAFALQHARKHGLHRVIYVIPFTSIIEQNAAVFREVMAPLAAEFGDVVLEHHSNFDPENETTASRLATENWDAPLVVTTSVQFYESLFANRSRRCRKLHRLANAVIILDEAQTLPVDLLDPCLRVLRELTENYGSTVVLCTATQPAVLKRDNFNIGLADVEEITSNPADLYTALKRVAVATIGPVSDSDLSSRLRSEEQVLCIVNTRKHAALLCDALGTAESHFHLSAAMCPIHRTEVLTEIKKQLTAKLPCRVVSTQLIEAGVHISFPVVFRSLAGVDAIAQAAGRCNRNGELPEGGKTWVFESEHTASEQYFAETANWAQQVLEIYPDVVSLEAVEHYFKLYYWDQKERWDAKHICDAFELVNDRKFPFLFSFAEVASRFRMIDSAQCPVIIPWDDQGQKLCETIRFMEQPGLSILRKLQRYTVQVRRRVWEENIGRTIEHVHGQFPVLMSPKMHYSPVTGLNLENDGGFLSI